MAFAVSSKATGREYSGPGCAGRGPVDFLGREEAKTTMKDCNGLTGRFLFPKTLENRAIIHLRKGPRAGIGCNSGERASAADAL